LFSKNKKSQNLFFVLLIHNFKLIFLKQPMRKISQVSPTNFPDSPIGKEGLIVMESADLNPLRKNDFMKDTLQQETPLQLNEIEENLSSLYEELKKRQPTNAYETIVLEIEPYEKKKNYELVRVKLEENIKFEDLENLASGNLTLSNQCKLQILNFFAYFQNVKGLCVLFTIFLNKGCSLKIEKDSFNRDVLDIALEYKNFSLSKSIIEDLTRNPPPIGKWPTFNLDKILAIFNMKIPDTGRLIDSRLYKIDMSPNESLSKPFVGIKAAFFEDFPKNEELKEELFYNRSNFIKYIPFLNHPNFVDYVQILSSDIIGVTEKFENIRLFLKKIYENYTPYDDIFKSVFVESLLEKKWYSYCFKLFLKEIFIFAFEVIFEQYGLETAFDMVTIEKIEIPNPNLYILLVIGVFIIFYLLFREIKEFVKEGFSYFTSVKSFIDIFYLISYGSFEIFLFNMIVSDLNYICCPISVEIAFILKSLLYFSFCLKGLWFVQVSPALGSMFRIILYSAIYSINFFVAYICLICALIISVSGLRPLGSRADVFLNFIANVQVTMGDSSSFFNLIDNSIIRMYALYGYYILSTLIITIISLNLFITIVGNGYAVLTSKEKNLINHTTLLVCLDLDSGYEITGGLGLKVKKSKMGFLNGICKFLLRAIILSKVKVRDRLFGKCFLISRRKNFEDTICLEG